MDDNAITDDEGMEKVVSTIKRTRIAMLTHTDRQGRLISHPMATQDVEFDGTVRFITERNSEKVADLTANPQVNIAYSGSGSWVSLSGTARIENDVEKIKELWSTFTDAWMEGGPENPNNVLIVVDGDTAEYWDAPGGSKVTQVAALVKALAGRKRPEGDQGTVSL